MKKLVSLVVIAVLAISVYAQDTLMLRNRRKVEGTITGASATHVFVTDSDGVKLEVPKQIIKAAYNGKKEITSSLMIANNAPAQVSKVEPNNDPTIPPKKLDTQEMALDRINTNLTMIAIPLWASLLAGVVLAFTM